MNATKYYRFAGLDIAVSAEETLFYTDERRLAPFAVKAPASGYLTFHFEVVPVLPAPEGIRIVSMPNFRVYRQGDRIWRYTGPGDEEEGKAFMAVEYNGSFNRVWLLENHYSTGFGTKTVLESIAAEHLIARNNGFIFHCSFIGHKGKAILFTAPSETGKSTQAELWHEYRGARIINGDRAVVRMAEGQILAEGIPFAGSSHYCENSSLPIAAIVYLEQAPRSTIRKMKGYEAFSRIWEGVSVNTWDRMDMEQVSAVVQRITEQIPVFHMPCTPDESAVAVLEEVLERQE